MNEFETRHIEIFYSSKIFEIDLVIGAKEEDVKNVAFEICQVLDGLVNKRKNNEHFLFFTMQNEIGVIDRAVANYKIKRENVVSIIHKILHTLVDSYNSELVRDGIKIIVRRDAIEDTQTQETNVNNDIEINKTDTKYIESETSLVADSIDDFLKNAVFDEINENVLEDIEDVNKKNEVQEEEIIDEDIEVLVKNDEVVQEHHSLAIEDRLNVLNEIEVKEEQREIDIKEDEEDIDYVNDDDQTNDNKPKIVEYKNINIIDNSIYKTKNKHRNINKKKKKLTKKEQIKKNNESSMLKMIIFVFVFIVLIIVVFIIIGLRKKALTN